jgi:hypothetical protein
MDPIEEMQTLLEIITQAHGVNRGIAVAATANLVDLLNAYGRVHSRYLWASVNQDPNTYEAVWIDSLAWVAKVVSNEWDLNEPVQK